MFHFLIVIQTNQFCIFDVKNTNPQLFPIKDGESFLPLSNLAEIGNLFKDYANTSSLEKFDFDIINATGKTDCINVLAENLLPCKSFQIRSFEMILPELLLKQNVMNDDSVKYISFDNKNYEVSIGKNGLWNAEVCSKEGESLEINDFTSLYTEGFSVNKIKLAKIHELEERIATLEKNNESIKYELACKNLKIRSIERKKNEEEFFQKKIENLKSKRQEIRLTEEMIDVINRLSASGHKWVDYVKEDKESVKKYDVIVSVQEYSVLDSFKELDKNVVSVLDSLKELGKNEVILAIRDGVFYAGMKYITKRSTSGVVANVLKSRKWHVNDLVGIIADPEDSEEKIRKYMEEVMREEEMKEFIQ